MGSNQIIKLKMLQIRSEVDFSIGLFDLFQKDIPPGCSAGEWRDGKIKGLVIWWAAKLMYLLVKVLVFKETHAELFECDRSTFNIVVSLLSYSSICILRDMIAMVAYKFHSKPTKVSEAFFCLSIGLDLLILLLGNFMIAF